MSTVLAPTTRRRGRPITLEEFDALPADGVRRWIIDGELREEEPEDGVSIRNPFHAITLSRLDGELRYWLKTQPVRPGEVLAGDAGFVLCETPLVLVGCDLAYLTAEQLRQGMPGEGGRLHVAPLLAIEVESPSNTVEDINQKIRLYLRHGVQLVWQVNTELRNVAIHRPDGHDQLVNRHGELTAEPHLPGFRCRVADLFYPG